MRRALVSILAAFVEVWCIFMVFCSGRLAYTWQWRIGYKPQSTIFFATFIVKAAGVTFHGCVWTSGELVYIA